MAIRVIALARSLLSKLAFSGDGSVLYFDSVFSHFSTEKIIPWEYIMWNNEASAGWASSNS